MLHFFGSPCTLFSIDVHCCQLLSMLSTIVHCYPLLNNVTIIHCRYHRLSLDGAAIYQTLPLVPKSSFFSKNGQKVRVYRFHFYLKNRKSKRETKTHARRMLLPPPHHLLCLILRRTQISWPKWNCEEKLQMSTAYISDSQTIDLRNHII